MKQQPVEMEEEKENEVSQVFAFLRKIVLIRSEDSHFEPLKSERIWLTTSCLSFVADLRGDHECLFACCYNFLFVCRDHAQGHFPVEGAV